MTLEPVANAAVSVTVNGEKHTVRSPRVPFDAAAVGAQAGSLELGGPGAASGEWPVRIDPHIVMQTKIPAETLADGRHAQRRDARAREVRLEFYAFGCPAGGVRRNVDSQPLIVGTCATTQPTRRSIAPTTST